MNAPAIDPGVFYCPAGFYFPEKKLFADRSGSEAEFENISLYRNSEGSKEYKTDSENYEDDERNQVKGIETHEIGNQKHTEEENK